jgi:hypothetical protein
MQKVRFAIRRTCELVIVAFVLFVFVNVGAEVLHKPILADKAGAPHGMIFPAAHAK